jgi:nucleoside-diphosphate-sugar epimerase
LLFDWIADGVDVFVLGRGDNRYQFVHASDLADACIRAGQRAEPRTYNIGTPDFDTMRGSLESLCAHAGTGARVRSLPMRPTVAAMRLLGSTGLAPFAPYHWIMYGRSMWFDTTSAEAELGWRARYSNAAMLAESYDWFLAHRDDVAGGPRSHHRSTVRQGLLSTVKRAMRVL